MKSEDAEKVVIVKPVASKLCSNFIADYSSETVEACRVNSSAAPAAIAVKPKTVKLKPARTHPLVELASSPGDASDTEICHSSDKAEAGPFIIYKPVAKTVSRSVASFMGNYEDSHQRCSLELASNGRETYSTELSCQTLPSCRSRQDTMLLEPSKSSPVIAGNNMITEHLAPSGDPILFDGYNWRKYGQKQVKGSEYPRSYYKCTHPNCPAKKKVERTLDGNIAEIIYNEQHNHPKPPPPKRLQGKGTSSDANGRAANAELWSTVSCKEKREAADYRMEDSNEADISLSSIGSDDLLVSQGGCVGSPDTFAIHGDNNHDNSNVGDGDYVDHYCKRRKIFDFTGTESTLTQYSEQDNLVQIPMDSDVSGDGFHWRKYGQKVVKGNPYPRSYYRCTHLQCNVRKHVERSSNDPTSVITTYEGKHNHCMPDRNVSSAASEPLQFPYNIDNTK